MAVKLGWAGAGFAPLHSEHVVQLYQEDKELVDNVTEYAAEAYEYEHSVLFAATGKHCDMFRRSLLKRGLDVDHGVREGRVTFLPVEDALPKIMDGDDPDEARFNALITRLLQQARKNGRYHHVQVFGEIVDVLWQQGNAKGTLRVEQLWNELRRRLQLFTLYCAFQVDEGPQQLMRGPMHDVLYTHGRLIHSAAQDTRPVAPRGVLVELADLTHEDATELAGAVQRFSKN